MATINVSAELDITEVLSEVDSEDLAIELSSRGDEAEVVGNVDTDVLVRIIIDRDNEDEILNAMTPETIINNLVGRGDTHEILSEISGKDIASFVVEESLIDQVVEFATIDEVVEAIDSGDLLNFLLHKMDIADAWHTLVGHEAFQDVPSSWLITELDNRGVNLGIPDEVLEASKVITNWINK